jgi:hypothetical protein
VNNAELYQALNYGVSKAVRAISASRPQSFSSWVEPFSIGGGVTEYDVSSFSPSLFRPWRLVCNGNQGASSVVLFKYASITTQEFEDAEVSTAGAVANQLVYDVLDGMLPSGTATTTADANATDTLIQLTVGDKVQAGNYLIIPGMVQYAPVGANPMPTDFTCLVTSVLVGTPPYVFVNPGLPVNMASGRVMTVMRRRVLKIVPALAQTYTGRLWYVYTPNRLRQDGDLLPISLADRHIDMVVSYAVGLLKRSVDDAMENRWALEATEMRSELMQDTEPISGQNSEALGSGLDWIGY